MGINEKTKKFYEKVLKPNKKQKTLNQLKKPLINHAIGDNQKKEYEWLAVRETIKKREPPLIEHKKVFQ